MSARILHPPCHAYIPRPSRPYPLDLSPRLSLLGNPGFRAERSVVCFVSASTCYAPLPALANKLLSGLRADDSVVSGDTHAYSHTYTYTHEGRRRVMTRASRLIARLPFSAARLPVNPGGEKRKKKKGKEKRKTRATRRGKSSTD